MERRQKGSFSTILSRFVLLFVLKSIELIVEPLSGHQLGMSSHFSYPSLMHDDNPVGPLNGGKPMGYDDGGSAFHELPQGILYKAFRFRINAGGSFIEDQNSWIYREGPGKRQELPLTSRQDGSTLLYILIQTPGEPLDEAVRVNMPDNPLDIPPGEVIVPQLDIGADIPGEEKDIL
jgi:hypothetical protein